MVVSHTCRYRKSFVDTEEAKKLEYLERVLEVEHGSFTPLIFGTNGGFGEECKQFLSTFATKLIGIMTLMGQ